ncbi:MAG: glycosyltransferase family 39 protein [Patescibacteria group bacterium]
MTSRSKDIWILVLLMALAIANFFVFGLIHDPGWKDAADYSAYAKNLSLGNGYSLDGVTFSIYREPGVSFYLLPFYKIFGIETPLALLAASFTQALLLGLLGFIIYRILKHYGETWIALVAGICIASQPILGHHTNETGAEPLFIFMLGVILLLCVRIMRSPAAAPWYWYALLGLAFGYEALVRFQFVLFPFFIAFFYLIYARPLSWQVMRNTIIALAVFAVIPLSFASYIYANTGVFAVTSGRQNDMLYYRAVRAELSYGEITRYLRDWLWRSISGGENTQFLTDNEFKKLGYEYETLATTSEAVARIRAKNIHTILSRPGHYLYGNVVEMVKLGYIEHDYSDTLNRYFRPVQYLFIYSFFLFGLYQLIRTKGKGDVRALGILALLFIFYNIITLSFFNVVPRFNTPYLPFFILIGFLGLILFRRTHAHRLEKTPHSV